MDIAPYPTFDGTQPCAEYDVDLFFPDGHKGPSAGFADMHPAIAVCRRCPFIRPCLAYALTHAVDGIWGGTFVAERDRIRRDAGVQADRTGLNYSESPSTEYILALHRGGASNSEIAERVGLTSAAVYERLKNQGALHVH